MRRLATAAVGISLGMCLFASRVDASERVTIMVGGIDKIIYLPAVLAKRYFEKQGLDVDVVTESAGVNAEDEMIAGGVQGVVGFYDHTIDLQAKGIEVESLVQFSDVPGEVMLVSKNAAATITSPADFKGQALGVTSLGSSTDFLTEYLASQAGLDHDDYRLKAVDAGTTFINAMRENRIAAGMTTEPTASRLISSAEARVLIDMRTADGTRSALGALYPTSCLYMPSSWVNAHRREAALLVRGFVMALRYLHTHSAEQIVAMLPRSYYAGIDKALYVKALKAYLPWFSADGTMPADGPKTVLRVMSTIRPQVKKANIDLKKTYTDMFVNEAAKQ
ncbi:ABC transporter substrate-binding protein [Bordetella sp. FB-8]|uniref:ABC transporter substrate-binding protein n=1 Tax=Bordetella sp. FB-8 TaxID=1159870 RepID=UPI000477E6AD